MAGIDYIYTLNAPAKAMDAILRIDNPSLGNISASAGDLLSFPDGEIVKIRNIYGGFVSPLEFEVIRGVGKTKALPRKSGEHMSVFFRRSKMEFVTGMGNNIRLAEGYRVVSPIDKDRYPERKGLEGPYRTKTGKVVYYDPKAGKYWDPDTDFFIPNERAADLFNFTESQIEHDIAKLILEEPDIDFAPAVMDYAGVAPQHIIQNGKDSLKELYTFTIKIDGNDGELKSKVASSIDSFAVSNDLLFWNLDENHSTQNLEVRMQFRPNRLIELAARRMEIDMEDVQDDLLICYNKLETWLKLLGASSAELVNGLNLDTIGLHESGESRMDMQTRIKNLLAEQDDLLEYTNDWLVTLRVDYFTFSRSKDKCQFDLGINPSLLETMGFAAGPRDSGFKEAAKRLALTLDSKIQKKFGFGKANISNVLVNGITSELVVTLSYTEPDYRDSNPQIKGFNFVSDLKTLVASTFDISRSRIFGAEGRV